MNRIILTIVILAFAGCSGSSLPSGSDKLQFSSTVWKDESSIQLIEGETIISKREMMLEDLVVNMLPGKTKDEIEDLLGPSIDTNYFSSVEKDFIYYMGPERKSFMAIDSEWLLIWVGENGIFERYSIAND